MKVSAVALQHGGFLGALCRMACCSLRHRASLVASLARLGARIWEHDADRSSERGAPGRRFSLAC
jgi:hypothetical protein